MKVLRSATYIILLLLLTGFAGREDLKAEPLKFMFEHYSSDDGLPHNSICDMHQDSRGYLWLCTWYGLSRYDGNGFVNYAMHPGDRSNLSHNRILSVKEDAAGYLWLTTYDYHLYRFDVDREEFLAVPSDLQDFPVSGIKVDNVHCDRNGNTWIGISGTGLMRVAPDLSYKHFFNLGDVNVGKEISAIYEDSEGTVYVASEVGISVIKGDEVSMLSRNDDVVSFAETGNLLLVAGSDQLLAVDRQTREQKKIDLGLLKAGDATSMTVSGGRIYVGFRDDAVASLSPETLEPVLHRNSMGRVRYLFPDPEGLLWIATERTGIWNYDSGKDRFRHYEHSRNVMSYYVDTLANVLSHDDRLWIKMNNYGFGYYDREKDEIVPLSNVKEETDCRFMNGVACYHVDDSGVLWMSTVGRGLEKVTTVTTSVDVIVPPTRSDDMMSSAEVRAMLKDSRGNVWIASKSRELYCYSSDFSTCRRFPDRLSGDVGVIYSIYEDTDGNIWLGTKGDGLIRMEPYGKDYRIKRFRHSPSDRNSLSSDNVYSICQDNEGRIWIGTFGGALSMLPDPDADEFVTVTNNFPDYPQEAGDRVRYIHTMPDGRVLVATVGGLIIFEPSSSPELTVFNLVKKISGDITSLGNNDVMHIFTASTGDVWLSTFGGGLNRLYFENGQPRFEVISTEDGLSSNIIQSAAEDADGKIWLATEAGLSSYDPETGNVRNYTMHDGVPGTSFSEATCVTLDDGSVLFGTYNNVYRIDPERFTDDVGDNRLVISGLAVDGRRTPFTDRIEIPHDCSFFRISFASLNFGLRGDYGFSYMLEGYDKDWITSTGSNWATYSRIPSGHYRFMVSCSGSGSSEHEDAVGIDVVVRSSVWGSPAAIAIYVLVGLTLAFLIMKIISSSLKLRSDIRLEQGLNDIKARFFTNVSHELRTPLTLILGGIDEIRRKTQEGDANEYSVNIVQKNAKRMLTLVNQLLDTRSIADGQMRLNISQFDVVKLVQDIYDDFRDMSAERQMEMRIIKSVDSLLVWGDSIRLEALVYNLLSNAFKYTSDGGKIEVGVLYRDGDADFRIMIKDNGIGIDKSMQKAIFEPFTKGGDKAFRGMASNGIGLSFCKEIADIHGGEIWVESEKGTGSKFFVRLPVGEGTRQADTYGLGKYKVEATHPDGALKVLVVEDNAELKVYIYNSLVSKYEVRDASNGKEALQVIADGWMPDMVVTDLMMPVMDGMELIDHLRNDFSTSHIPIVMITAKHEDDTQVRAMKYGADGYIAKPFTMELLMARIDNMLDRRKELVSAMSTDIASEGKRAGKIEISPEEIVITDKDEQLIKKVMTWLEENVSDAEVTVDQLSSYVGMGRTSMYNKIKGLTGKSPVELIQEFRMEKATYYLKSGQFSVSETSYKVGFSDPGYFSRSFKKHFGISPADYMKQNKKK
ncbi:MAG: response regulator [Bacteroidales bacterium]|nr:response regulator [Bacteroidales bacterium]